MRIKHIKLLSIVLGSTVGVIGTLSYLGASSLRGQTSFWALAQSRPTFFASGIAVNFQTTDELIAASELIVRGKFTGKPLLTLPRRVPDLPTAASENEEPPERDPNLIYQRDPGHRDLVFVVQEVLKGDKTTKQIIVGQRGAINEDTTVDTAKPTEGDTLFKPGDSYILFLTKALPHEAKIANREFYWVVGSVQGAYRIKNKKVYSRNVEVTQLATGEEAVPREIEENVGPNVEGIPEDTFIADLRRKIK